MFIPYPGSEFFPSRIQRKNDSRIPKPNPHQRIFSIFTQQIFLNSRKYDSGFSPRIRIMIFYLSRIPDPEHKKAPDPWSGSATLSVTWESCRNMLDDFFASPWWLVLEPQRFDPVEGGHTSLPSRIQVRSQFSSWGRPKCRPCWADSAVGPRLQPEMS
jgi:hypothetical protein